LRQAANACGAGLTAILGEGHVADLVRTVFDPPVAALQTG
jgi:hypothetical protein